MFLVTARRLLRDSSCSESTLDNELLTRLYLGQNNSAFLFKRSDVCIEWDGKTTESRLGMSTFLLVRTAYVFIKRTHPYV